MIYAVDSARLRRHTCATLLENSGRKELVKLPVSGAVEVRTSNTSGQGLFAARGVAAGKTVFSESVTHASLRTVFRANGRILPSVSKAWPLVHYLLRVGDWPAWVARLCVDSEFVHRQLQDEEDAELLAATQLMFPTRDVGRAFAIVVTNFYASDDAGVATLGKLSSRINHSAAPNVASRILMPCADPHDLPQHAIVLEWFAVRPISRGEELLTDYGQEYAEHFTRAGA